MASILLSASKTGKQPVARSPFGAKTMTDRHRVRLVPCLLAFFLMAGWAGTARAQGYLAPFIGFDFGGDANCPQITGCEDKRLNFGIGLGKMGSVFGFEEEFAYAKDFFGTAPTLNNSSVLTVMSNAMFVPNIGPIRPYALAGLGLIKTHVELNPTSLLTTTNNNFGWDIGGGVIIGGAHIGVRGDIRYFHSFQDQTIAGFALSNPQLNFGRASAALMLMF
jgi:opacity protein-like surface antigen